VRAWLRAQGFAAVQADAQRDYVRATATVGAIDAAFQVTMKRYRATTQASGGGGPLQSSQDFDFMYRVFRGGYSTLLEPDIKWSARIRL